VVGGLVQDLMYVGCAGTQWQGVPLARKLGGAWLGGCTRLRLCGRRPPQCQCQCQCQC
jgi:hypothetical protein